MSFDSKTELSAIILAAGKGTRMKSKKPKVLHEIFSKPLVGRVVEAIDNICPDKNIKSVVVVGHGAQEVEKYLTKYKNVTCVLQKEQLGTGHAVSMALDELKNFKGTVIIACGDTPLLKSSTLRKMCEYHIEHSSDVTVMSAIFENPFGYGRIVRAQDGSVEKIVEQKDADEEQKAIFANAKVNDVLVFNPNAAFKGNEAELSSLLKIKKEEVAAHTGNFSFQIIEITRYVDGELNQEIFDQVFGKDAVKTEEEFRTKVREMLAANLVADSDYRFLVDARNYLANKIGKLEFPDALLKRIMLHNNEDKGEAFVAENYDKSIEELTWHLIKEQLVQANDIKVEKDDIEKMAKEVTRIQFAQYGMLNVPDDLLANYAQEMMKKQDSVNNLVNRVIEAKLTVALKKQVTLNNKSVTLDEFNKLFA